MRPFRHKSHVGVSNKRPPRILIRKLYSPILAQALLGPECNAHSAAECFVFRKTTPAVVQLKNRRKTTSSHEISCLGFVLASSFPRRALLDKSATCLAHGSARQQIANNQFQDDSGTMTTFVLHANETVLYPLAKWVPTSMSPISTRANTVFPRAEFLHRKRARVPRSSSQLYLPLASV